MTNDDGSSNEEQIYNTLYQNDNTVIGISDGLNKSKTEVIALKMFVSALFVKAIGWLHKDS